MIGLARFPTLHERLHAAALAEAKGCRKAKLSGHDARLKVLRVVEMHPGAKAVLTRLEGDYIARLACALAGYQEYIRTLG